MLDDDEQAHVVDAKEVARRRRPHGRSLVAIQQVCSEPETDLSTEVDAHGDQIHEVLHTSVPTDVSVQGGAFHEGRHLHCRMA